MPIKPNLLERTLFFTLNQGPAPLMEIWGGLAFRTVSAAVRLGVFEALSNSPQTIDALAEKLQLNPRGSAILLEALETLGYVSQQNSHYSLSPMAQKWVSPSAEMNFSPYFTFWDVVMRELWQNLEESLRTGEAPTNLYTWIEDHPQVSMDFQQAMIAMARLISGEIAGKLNFLAGVQRLLDVGGGHAEYSIALCNKYPNLKAMIFDSPQALVAGRENAAAAGVDGRVEFLEGSFLTNELPGGFDAVLVFNILHG